MNLRGPLTLSLLSFLVAASTMTFAEENMERLIIGSRPNPVKSPLIVPNYLAAQDSLQASHTFTDAGRIQQVYQASEFGTSPILITGIYWRPTANPDFGAPFHTVDRDFRLNLSTTSKQPDQLSSVFAENIGRDEQLVFKGPLAISSRFQDAAGGTKKFDIFVRLKHPFFYNPAKGNLLVDIRNFQPSTATYVNAHGLNGDSGSRIVAFDPNATTASFTDTGVDVIQVVFTRMGRTPLPFIEQAQFSN